MFNEEDMKFVPAYYAANGKGQRVPFIVSLMMVDDQNKAALPPAVSASIDRTLSITGTEGVAFANIYNVEPLDIVVPAHVDRAMTILGALVLFRCQSPETAENLMGVMNQAYTLTLVKDQRSDADD
ncbi:hypothetical protein [Pseudomonas syringae]|jgi:hypothetical protein|uniref:Uncharacterized protein n=1 Tax=Pseudomonas syringae pv. actinidiae TaxID=103796 RepID=A0A286JZQ9_PSESF|nr:hypothetical protein [Pseudomonas syringae]PHX44374.1 hypothetical protein AO263_17555 [Pseudomonas sp. NZIPFR-PS5]AMW88283.1 hypothetical protein [Pseudomonas syringae pv. actinidiae]ARO44809.1 hypothetical protein [Pseudomonas syringae pv. actinidiae]OKS58563.1 hypothetical protein PsaNZ66_03370 [Pseudomonas syringae pv. actinidiae]OKS79638.1 hypothetical protein PsaNZ65_02945 [Pseudomonas syringae pv. actinidiae]